MECVIHIKTGFKSVFLLNGSFVEKADSFSYNIKEPLYITVLPLSAHLLPYTVKILGSKTLSNESLCSVYTLAPARFLIKLAPRYNYVFSPEHSVNCDTPRTEAESFFHYVKSGKLSLARELMTKPLSESIDDESLRAFFDGFTDIVKNEYLMKSSPHSYFLIDPEGKATLFEFVTEGRFIDNIMQNE